MRKRIGSGAGSLLAVLVLAACGGEQAEQPPVQEPAGQTATPETGAPTTSAPPALDTELAGDLPPGVTAEMVAQGQQHYGTVCVACHGAAGVGTPLGPPLNDQEWLDIDGDYESIVRNIQTGVPQPVEYPAPMPPLGGGSFNEEQVRAIAAYVYALSRGML